MESLHTTDVIVIGSGISGLMTAICLYPRKVTLISKKKLGEASSSAWAQGGIAAAVGKDDSPKIHFEDTIKASSGLSDEKIVKIITEEASSIIKFLEESTAVRYLQRPTQDIAATGGTNWQQYLPPRMQLRIFFPWLWTESQIESWGKKDLLRDEPSPAS